MRLLFNFLFIFGFTALPFESGRRSAMSEEIQPAPCRAVLLFAGDLMQHLPQVAAARRAEGFDYGACFEYVTPYFRQADLAFVNLETTLTTTNYYTGYPCFRSPVQVADALQNMGVDVAVMANNHCCDAGGRGVVTTVAELTMRGIEHTGVFTDSTDYKRNNPLYLRAGNISFALLNYTYATNGIPVPQGVLVNALDTVRMARDLATICRDTVDCVIAFLHWGNEYERKANASQRKIATFLQRNGVDLIIGSHPHVAQPFEQDSTHITLFSLGNFVSNQRNRHCDGGLMAEICVEKSLDGRLKYALQIIPVWVLCPNYRILPPAVGDTLQMPASARAAYTQFKMDTRQLLYE
ncbi:MAG: CapA family protein [Alistipes sp.]